jgi:pimeloyl-ACP methyl ester carboxylesterase
VPETAYAKCGELSLAYQVVGEGPVELVFAGSFITHVELMWTSPETKAWFDRLSSFCRLLLFDKAGVGLSDPVAKVRSIEDRAREIEAVMDAAGFGRAALMGLSEGGPASLFFAATRPDRVSSLVVAGTYAWTGGLSWDDMDGDVGAVLARVNAAVGERYAVTLDQAERLAAFGRAVRTAWGSGEALGMLVPSLKPPPLRGMMERMSASPGMARATVEALFRIDVRPLLPSINVPTLVIHARDDLAPIQFGRMVADAVPGARFVEIAGKDHAPWFADVDAVTSAIETFLTGSANTSPSIHRVLRTVLFTDIVASTEHVASVGDGRWRAVLERFGDVTKTTVERFGGNVVKSTGDGHLATFEGPTPSIRAAGALVAEARLLGLELRVGLHTGECELTADDISGMAVHIAARVLAEAGAGEIVATSVVRDLVVGTGVGFTDRGLHELRGVPGRWQLVTVDPDGARPGSREHALVALPTPSPRTAMRRVDRAAAVFARRAPKLTHAAVRLAPKVLRGER